MSIESMMPSNHLVLSHPLLAMPSISFIFKVFSKELALPIRWSKYWSFSFSISSSKEYSGLISFRINCFDLLTVQQTLQWLLQHCDAKESIFCCSAFFTVQLSHPYMTNSPALWCKRTNFLPLSLVYGPTLTSTYDYLTSIYDKALTSQTFVSQVMSLYF